MTITTPLSDVQRQLVEKWVGLAQGIAMRFWYKSRGKIDREEIVSIAYQGLVTAAEKYDFDYRPPNDSGYDPLLAFPVYARTRITGTVQDWLRKIDHLSRRQRRMYQSMQEFAPGRTAEDTAQILGVDVSKIRAITYAVECPSVSLDEMHDPEMPDRLATASTADTEAETLTKMIQQAVADTYSRMSPMEKSVLALRYYSGLDFGRIAITLGASTSVVKQIHQEAIASVHDVMRQAATS